MSPVGKSTAALPSLPVLVAMTAIGSIGMQVILPALPSIARDLQAPVSSVQWLITLYMLMIAGGQLVYGPVSDRFGRRIPLMVGLAILVAGSLLCAFATNLPMLLAGRVIQAAGACAGVVMARAMVRDVYAPDQAVVALGRVAMAQTIAPALSPIVGGLLLLLWSWRVPFLMTGMVGLWLLVSVWRVRETIQKRTTLPSVTLVLGNYARLFRLREFSVPAIALGCTSVAFSSFTSIAPAMMDDVLGVPAAYFGWYFVFLPAGFFLGSYFATRLTRRIGAERTSIVGAAVSAVAGCAILASVLVAPPMALVMFVLMGFVTLGNGLNQPALVVRAVGANPRLIGAASGLVGFVHLGLGAVGAQFIAVIYDRSVAPVALVVMASEIVVLLLLVLFPARPPPG